uniref:Uncharacterized protein n=1 Tax=Anguilla anguilla TaxID=7936 RepID=A0A0E9XRQ1_ANGAN
MNMATISITQQSIQILICLLTNELIIFYSIQ